MISFMLSPDSRRSNVLEEIDENRRTCKIFIWAAGITEAVCLTTFLLLMDFGERSHWLLLVAAVLIYGTLGLGLVALGAHSRACMMRVLQVLLEDRQDTTQN